MNIGVIGAGIVGGTTGKVLASKHRVHYYDRYKEGLSGEDRLAEIACNAEVVFICVPTPMKPSGEMDYSALYDSLGQLQTATERVSRDPKDLIAVIRSTAVSGTTDRAAQQFPFRFAFNPEFLRQNHAEEDMLHTTRVVVGANDNEVHMKLAELYRAVFPDADYTFVDIKTAEMIKYAANVMLASQIAIANELYRICEGVGVTYDVVKTSLLADPRIGRNIAVPGHDGNFGFGGKCFPKDLRALTYLAREHNVDPYLLEEVWRSNLAVRKHKDWLEIQGATTGNTFGESRVL